jgi:hypothetical protein
LFLYLNDLTGTLPTELGLLTGLEYVDLSFNQFTGTLPTELGNLSNLSELYLEYNEIRGTIPSSLGNLDLLSKRSTYWHSLFLSRAVLILLLFASFSVVLQIHQNNLVGDADPIVCTLGPFSQVSADCLEVQCDCCTCCRDDLSVECWED